MNESAMLDQVALNMATMWSRVARASGGRDRRMTGAWAADAHAPNAVLNRVTVLQRSTDAQRLASDADAFYTPRRGLPYGVVDSFGELDLSPAGFERIVELPCMVRPPDTVQRPVRSAIRIERVREEADLRAFERVLFSSFHYVPWPPADEAFFGPALLRDDAVSLFVGYLDDEPVSCSASCAAAEVVGVYLVATRDRYRGKGIGEALSWVATRVETGWPAALQASPMGMPVYRRMGYREITRIPFWSKILPAGTTGLEREDTEKRG